jgi:pyruvate formate lyase activating enzyme
MKDNNLSDAPLHFSRFFPQYRMKDIPPTPVSTLQAAKNVALEEGIKYVYLGNV